MELWLIWMVIAVILAVAEMFAGTFYLLWLGISCFAAGLVGLAAPDAIGLQTVIAAIMAVVLTMNTKRLTRRFTQSPGYTQNPIDALLGKTGHVIDLSQSGDAIVVKVGSETWTAKSEDQIAIGDHVEVIGGHTTILQVKKVSN
jgi:membrane protein implicated in regulation of membrane protease activity